MEKHTVAPENAALFMSWIESRQGLAIWKSIDLSNPGLSWTTPVLDKDGNATQKPHWRAESQPSRIITDPSEVDVVTGREVKRFRVAIRRDSAFQFVLTDASSRRLKKELDKAGEKSWYDFDYFSQEAVIYVPSETVPLAEFCKRVPS